jgi:hypothetical protein
MESSTNFLGIIHRLLVTDCRDLRSTAPPNSTREILDDPSGSQSLMLYNCSMVGHNLHGYLRIVSIFHYYHR